MMPTLFQVALMMFVVFMNSLEAQDTIRLVDGKMIGAKVLEVEKDQVKFKMANNLDGPDFVYEIKKIYLIKYRNGQIDTINAFGAEKTAIKILNKQYKEINKIDEKYYWNSDPPKRIGFNKILSITEEFSHQNNLEALKIAILNTKSKRSSQKALGITSIPFFGIGGVSLLGGYVSHASARDPNSLNFGRQMLIFGALNLGVAVGLQVFSIMRKNQKKKKLTQTVMIYNQELKAITNTQ